MTPRVREILSWYQADKPAVLTRLAQVLNHGRLGGSGKLLLMNSGGLRLGPAKSYAMNPDSYDPIEQMRAASELGVNALIAPAGSIELAIRDFAGEFPFLVQANQNVNLQNFKTAFSNSALEAALDLGANGLAFSLPIGMEGFEGFVHDMSEQVQEAKENGLLVFISVEKAASEERSRVSLPIDQATYGIHLAAQMGAHIIQTAPLDGPVSDQQKAYEEMHIVLKNEHHRVRHAIQTAFAGQRILLGSFRPSNDESERAESLREWMAAGAMGMNLEELGLQPRQRVLDELKNFETILLGDEKERVL